MAEEHRNYIGGQWVPAASGETFESRNPANRDELLATFPRSSAEDVDRAVRAAHDAYRDWMMTPVPDRADYLMRVGLKLEERKEELSELMTREMGKTLKESRGDVQEGIDFLYYMAGEGRRFFGHTMPSELRNKFSMTVRHPIGVVGLITPWNFPIAIPLWKIAPAVVSGCASVFKPAEDTPLLATLLVQAFEEVGLPAGVLNLVHGVGEEAGAALVDHPDVRAISFTGSLEVGRMVAERCGAQMKRCSLELGSKNVLIVMPDADMELAVEASAWGAFATSGQRCTATSRLVVHEAARDEFTERLLDRVKTMKVGSGLEPDVELAPVINEKQKERILKYIEIGKEEGAVLLTGGEELTGDGYDKGNFVAPTVFDEMTPDMRIAQEEIFGPVTGIIRTGDVDEAIRTANSTKYGLSASIYTHDITNVFKAVQQLEFGIVYVNAPTIGAEVQLPFGGMKSTGNGHREAGPQALDEFTEWKAVSVDFSGTVQKAQGID
ncbi:MAG TPA: aldehyde dehydrogenase family protein [Actinomycetota bacterium]|nr:aldehyde dehydrogenase family protein [Actinomycetota bacterium]